VGRREAAEFLNRLLTSPGRYRRRWERVSLTAVGPDQVHLPGVCAVVADYLIDAGELSESDPSPTRRIKDRVRRALSGEVLTPSTVRAFAGAFGFEPADLERLEALLSGSSQVRVLSGSYSGSPELAAHRRHRTISLHEHHYVNADHLPYRHRTTQVIEATEDGMAAHRYIFDSTALTVDVLHGGTVSGPAFVVGDGLFGVDIVLTRPLNRGDTSSLDYETRFSYPEPPAPEFRRAGLARMIENVDIVVQFDPAVTPREVYFSTWEALDGPPVTDAPMDLESDGSVHIYLARLDHVIAGFRWVW
jgi:hypothetical protein